MKWGMKVFVISDSRTGYVYTFEPYYGAATTAILPFPEHQFTMRIVMLLAERVRNQCGFECGFHIYTDRLYTSLALAQELAKIRIHLTGTVLGNRQGNPSSFQKKNMKSNKMQLHEVRAFRHKDNVLVLAWRDQRDVTMLSTVHNPSVVEIVRNKKGSTEKEKVLKPTVIMDYNERMGGVDAADHYISSYLFVRKSKKWWRKMFFWLLEVSVVNSFLLYNMYQQNIGNKCCESKKFREMLLLQLVGDFRNPSGKRRGRPSTSDKEGRLNQKPHFIASFPGVNQKKDCAVCSNRKVPGQRRETHFFCETCERKPGLHPGECFKRYHTLKDYKP